MSEIIAGPAMLHEQQRAIARRAWALVLSGGDVPLRSIEYRAFAENLGSTTPMKLILSLALGLALAGSAQAASADTPSGKQAPQATLLSRHDAVEQLVMRWGPEASRNQRVSIKAWADRMVPLFRSADLGNLNKALSSTSYSGMVMTMMGSKPASATALPGGFTPESLGSTSSDLVYTPLTSCLLVDTRVVGGIFTAGAVRNYKASGTDFTAQGGSNTNCGIPSGVNALVVMVQSVNATAKGYFRMWPYGTSMPAASVMSYGVSQNTQNNVIQATSVGLTNDFSVQSSATSHLVVAVLGYFAAPTATMPDCTYTTKSISVAAGSFNADYATCAAGYAATGGSCSTFETGLVSNANEPGFADPRTWFCSFSNPTAGAHSGEAAARCCRIPGR